VFSAGHIGPKALHFGGFQSVARSGQESLAQGLPWVPSPPEWALKGPLGLGWRASAPKQEARALHVSAPSGLSTFFG
jgi:hypothetical protein